MTRRSSQKDLLDVLSNFIAHNKGFPVFAGVGLALLGLLLNCFPSLSNAAGFGGWVVRSNLFLYLGVVVGFLGILAGDAL